MSRETVDYTAHYDAVMNALTTGGLLMGSYDAAGKPNIMTIGWGSLGSIWGEPMWIVLVRPSRYTYSCVEHSGCFTVNAPSADMAAAMGICGTLSGRDTDKFAECGLTAEKGSCVLAPRVAQSPLVYECQVVHSNDLIPAKLDKDIISGAYTDGDYHRVYFGKILSVTADPQAAELIG